MAAVELTPVSDACADRILRNLEQMSPVVTHSLQGPMRDVVLAAMAACFTEGSLYGAKKIADALADEAELARTRREDYRNTLKMYP